jgi:hypothetical protein
MNEAHENFDSVSFVPFCENFFEVRILLNHRGETVPNFRAIKDNKKPESVKAGLALGC